MNDPREAILLRLVGIAAMPALGFATVVRNVDDIPDLARPAACIMDGDEEADEEDPKKFPPSAPRRVTMKAEMVILAGGQAAEIGGVVNTLRYALIHAVQNDAQLAALVLDGTRRQTIRYIGTEFRVDGGRAVEAEARVSFSFTYILVP